MNAKKIIALLLALDMCVGLLAACGEKNPGTSDQPTNNPTPEVERLILITPTPLSLPLTGMS